MTDDCYPAPDELRDFYMNDYDSGMPPDVEDKPNLSAVPVLAEPPPQLRVATHAPVKDGGEARESTKIGPEQKEADSRGGAQKLSRK